MQTLMTFYIVGCAIAKVKHNHPSLIPIDTEVFLAPDPTNPYDGAAITVSLQPGKAVSPHWLGFVPAEATRYIHVYFKANRQVKGTIVESNIGAKINKLLSVRVDVEEIIKDSGQESTYVQEVHKDAARWEFLTLLQSAMNENKIHPNTWEAEFIDSTVKRKTYSDKQREVIGKLYRNYNSQLKALNNQTSDDEDFAPIPLD